ncbi:MAG: hypothetical protein H7Y42_09580 [Chitinophagaceae bacterium]|nr:hypothetical protein [Chitinophagaceae bacterium]
MNRLTVYTALLLLLTTSVCYSQTGFLFVKKGYKKKRTYTEGDRIHVRLQDGTTVTALITLLRNDTIWLNGKPIHRTFVKEVLLKRGPKRHLPDAKTMALIGVGSAMTSAGLILSKQAETTEEGVVAGAIIGFGPLLIKHFAGRVWRVIPRGKFRIGRKFHLQVLDFHRPREPRKKTF